MRDGRKDEEGGARKARRERKWNTAESRGLRDPLTRRRETFHANNANYPRNAPSNSLDSPTFVNLDLVPRCRSSFSSSSSSSPSFSPILRSRIDSIQ